MVATQQKRLKFLKQAQLLFIVFLTTLPSPQWTTSASGSDMNRRTLGFPRMRHPLPVGDVSSGGRLRPTLAKPKLDKTKFGQVWTKPSLAKRTLAKPTFLAKVTRISVLMFWANFCVWPMLGLPGPLLPSTKTQDSPSPGHLLPKTARHRTPTPTPGPPFPRPPKISLFFSSPATIFTLSSYTRVLLVECW